MGVAGQHHQPDAIPDEADMLARLRNGDRAAFELLVRSHAPRILSVARRFFRSEDDANDIVQETFFAAFRSLDRFQGHARLGTWLHRIAVNACLMKQRSDRRRPARSIEELLPGFEPDGHQSSPARSWKRTAADGIESGEQRELIRSAIDQLPEPYRTVLVLRDIEELDTRQTAELLQTTENAVKTRLHRARQALRELLDPAFREDRA